MNWFTLDEMEQFEYSTKLAKINKSFSSDFHKQATPFSLCIEMIEKVGAEIQEEKNWLVIANLEFVIALKEYFKYRKWNFNRVSFVTPCENKGISAKFLGVGNVYEYSYDNFKEWKIDMKFDVIIGNPPYQAEGAFKGSNILWPNFFKIANSMINENGYISLVHPYTWTSSIKTETRSSKPLLDIWNRGTLLELNLNAHRYFNVGSSTICYVVFKIEKNRKNNMLKIVYPNFTKTINIENYDFIPNGISSDLDFSILEKVLFNKDAKLERISGGGHRKKVDNQFPTVKLKYKQAYTWANFKRGNHLYSENEGILQNKNKVICFYSSNCDFVYDDGEFGLGEMTAGVTVNNKLEGDNLISILNSKLFWFVSKFKPYSGTHGGRPATIKHFPKLNLEREWTDNELYNYFKLTQEEIDLIEGSTYGK